MANNALLQRIAAGAQPRIADAMFRGAQQGNALMEFQREEQKQNALAEIAQAYATGGPQAASQAAGRLGQLGPAMQIDKQRQAYEIAQRKSNQPLSKYGKAQWDETRGYAPKGSAAAALSSSNQPLTKVVIDQGKKWNKYTTDRYGDARTAAQSAQSMNSQLGQYKGFLDQGVKTGWSEPWKMEAKRIFGVDLKGVAGQEALTSISNRVIAPLVKQLGSNPTDRDLAFITASIPRLGSTEAGNRLMISALEIANRRQIEEYNFARQYMQQNGPAFQQDPFAAQVEMDNAFEEFKVQNPELFDGATQQLMQQFEQIGGDYGGKSDQTKPESTKTINGVQYEKHNGQWFVRQ